MHLNFPLQFATKKKIKRIWNISSTWDWLPITHQVHHRKAMHQALLLGTLLFSLSPNSPMCTFSLEPALQAITEHLKNCILCSDMVRFQNLLKEIAVL
ncbi:hypothetical protein DAI22_08g078100 [Oryza sativa Japonica Group]|jgi:uncharacterized metal-binding protein|uniref:Uncharacterized protein n=1 Tax=Oryza rufipogon TaxID=4529 RepID=A0A0E0QG24_ORYRU|nr:hypothetical protein DAI22_08g078100 [Oryza sativa Japonica Group]